jgi:hypothetical protein
MEEREMCYSYILYFLFITLFNQFVTLISNSAYLQIGTIAGNLMTKHRNPKFSSDVFLLFEGIGATISIGTLFIFNINLVRLVTTTNK